MNPAGAGNPSSRGPDSPDSLPDQLTGWNTGAGGFVLAEFKLLQPLTEAPSPELLDQCRESQVREYANGCLLGGHGTER